MSKPSAPEVSLTEEDWITAGTDLLALEGARGVQISVLCQHLGVTKGSFYWHFKSLAELFVRLLSNWRQRATLDIIDRLAATQVHAGKAVIALLALPRRTTSRRGTGLEQSIRDWARRDPQADHAVQEIDRLRLDFFERMLRAQGLAQEHVRARSYLAYCIMMGDSILQRSFQGSLSEEDYLNEAALVLGIGPADQDA